MRKKTRSGYITPRVLVAAFLGAIGLALGVLSLAATPTGQVATRNSIPPISPLPARLPPGFSMTTGGLSPGVSLPPVSVNPIIDSRGRISDESSLSVPETSAVTGSWSIAPSPNGGFAPTSLSAVTCVTASDCWAVGRTEIGHTYANTALLHWNGSSWQVTPSPSVEQETNGLVDISCVSSSSCWAVGYRIILQTVQVQTLILRWDGVSWQIVPSPNVGSGFNALYGVSCSSESDCWAVGFKNGGSQATTLIHRWDGVAWTVHDSPNVGSQNNVLNAITCLSSSDCRAVGYSGAAGAKSSLVAQWNGSAWTGSVLPSQPLAQENNLTSITCNSASSCWAVGDTYNGAVHQTLIEQWNGTSWASAVTPNGGADNYLSRVTCASALDCWAVGNSSNAAIDPQGVDQDLILHWNGLAWSLNTDLLDPTATYAKDLAGVACASGSDCWAVGSMQPSGSGRPQIVRWNGTSWMSAVAPDVPAKPSNFLDGVTCVSASDCWTVGFNFYGNVARSQAMHWDGTAWTIINSPNTALDRNNYLADVTCLSTSDCWTVGSSTNDIGVETQALSMHWNGTAWSIVDVSPIDTSQTAETTFEGIACASSSDCWAVGYSLIQDYQGLLEHWNGTSWSLVTTPPMPDPSSRSIFYHIACTGTSDCTAVGVQWTTALTGSGLYQTLVAHWNGSAWSVVPSPNTAADQDNILSSVTCNASTDCWAVGSYDNYSKALIERWDGVSWTIATAPQVGRILNAVTCASTSDCWAAGPYYTPNPPSQTLLVHWDGTSWTPVLSPNTGPTDSNNLAGIACASSSDCWAVGQYWRKGSPQTLTLHYTVAPILKIISITRHQNGHIILTGLGLPGVANTIEASPDMSQPFSFLATVVPDASGAFEIEDQDAGSFTKRFYRLVYP